jgi:hypothetical protein
MEKKSCEWGKYENHKGKQKKSEKYSNDIIKGKENAYYEHLKSL